MSYLPSTYVFDGKRYKLHNDYLKASDSRWNAEKLRSKGYLVRQIKILGLWGVYKRKK